MAVQLKLYRVFLEGAKQAIYSALRASNLFISQSR